MQSATVLWVVLGVCVVICEINCDVCEAGNSYTIRFHKVKPTLGIWR